MITVVDVTPVQRRGSWEYRVWLHTPDSRQKLPNTSNPFGRYETVEEAKRAVRDWRSRLEKDYKRERPIDFRVMP